MQEAALASERYALLNSVKVSCHQMPEFQEAQSQIISASGSIYVNLQCSPFVFDGHQAEPVSNIFKNSRLGALDLTGGRLCSAYCLQANAGRQSRLLKFEGCVRLRQAAHIVQSIQLYVTNFEPVQSCAVMCSHVQSRQS